MAEEMRFTEEEFHKKFAVDCFNRTWDLLEKAERSIEEADEMLFTAHASLYHWSKVGKPINIERGHWQISRVNAVLNQPDAALYHAKRCLDICIIQKIGDFDIAFAFEAMARGNAVAERKADRDNYIALAKKAAAGIAKDEDREYFLSELKTVPGYKD
jgi:hypothetical protein